MTEPYTKEQILEMKSEIELGLKRATHLAALLKEQGYTVHGSATGDVYIYKQHTQVEEYGTRPESQKLTDVVPEGPQPSTGPQHSNGAVALD